MIKFDCSSIPPHANVTNSTLSLTGTNGGGYGDANVCIYTLDQPWKENEVSWSNATNSSYWQNGGGDYTNLVIKQREDFNSVKTFTFDVTSAIRNFVNNPTNNHGFILIPERIADIIYYFKSKENSDISGRPKLTISYDLQSNKFNTIKNPNNKLVWLNYSNNILEVGGLKKGDYYISIYNVKGKTLYKKNINVSDQVFIRNLKFSKGTYIINIKGNHIIFKKSLIIK